MIITGERKPRDDTIENTWDITSPTEGPAGEVIESTSEEQLDGRIAANGDEFDRLIRISAFLNQRNIENAPKSEKEDLIRNANSACEMLIRGTFETSDENARLSASGVVLHNEDFDTYWEEIKALEDGLSEDELKEASKIELPDGKEDVANIIAFTNSVCEKITPINVRAARSHEMSYIMSLQNMLNDAMHRCSLSDIAHIKEVFYNATARIQEHFIEMMRKRDEEKARSFGGTSVEIAKKVGKSDEK